MYLQFYNQHTHSISILMYRQMLDHAKSVTHIAERKHRDRFSSKRRQMEEEQKIKVITKGEPDHVQKLCFTSCSILQNLQCEIATNFSFS